jgi:hypothetical protein
MAAGDTRLIGDGDRLFAREPVEELLLHDASEELARALAEKPWLARVRSLTVRGRIGDAGLRQLLQSGHIRKLRALNVSNNELGRDAMRGVAHLLESCGSLVLTGNQLSDGGATALGKWSALGDCRALYLARNEIHPQGLEQLLASVSHLACEKLCLSGNPLGDEGAAIVARAAAKLPRLKLLELEDTQLGESGAAHLAEANFPSLVRLRVGRNDPDAFAILRDAFGERAEL